MNDRRALLTAALGFLQLPAQTSGLRALHAWLDSWTGVRAIATTMRVERHAVALKRGRAGWTAAFSFTANTNLPPAAPSGLATAPTPWQAVQLAAWQVLRREL